MKKYIRLSVLLLLVAALLVSQAGCSVEIEDNEEIRYEVDRLLSALIAGDEGAGYAAVYSGINRQEFRAAFDQMAELIAGVESYGLTPIGYNYHSGNGVTTRRMTYRMTTNTDTFVVEAAMRDDCDGLVSFYIVPEEQTALTYTGALGHMEGASLFQWLLVVVSLAVWGFVVWMAVDCCRRKIRKKWLWLLLIVLGGMMLTLTFSVTTINFRFNVGLYLHLSGWLVYGDGTRQLRLVIPIGALIYFFRRKKLSTAAAEETAPQEKLPEQADGEEQS